MPFKDATPAYFIPTGLADAVDETSAFKGACQTLTNFVFDRVNRGAVVPRPGNVPISFSTSGFTTPGVISAMCMVGPIIYGMIGTADFTGKDRPFAYNVNTGSFITLTGATAANLPTTQSTGGDWQPAHMEMIGIYIVITHPGYSGGANPFFGYINTTTNIYAAGNTATNALPSVPLWVSQFFGRAYFSCKNALIPTDILNPLNVTNTEFADTLTVGDTSNIAGTVGLPVGTTSGGVLQALLVFKNKSIYQVTGDLILNNLALNQVSDNIGTYAPRTMIATPDGVAFMSPTAVRVVNLLGVVNFYSTDVVGPFTNTNFPSRAAAVFSNSVYRISVNTTFKSTNSSFNDYWFDNVTRKWNGPHTFPFNCMVSDGTNVYGTNDQISGMIFFSQCAPLASTVYTDNTVVYNCSFQSCNLEETDESVDKQIIESTVELSSTTLNSTYTIQLKDEQGNVLNSVSMNVSSPASVWGSFTWGVGYWQASTVISGRYGIPWTNPIVYDKLSINLSVPAANYVAVKKLMNRVKRTNHMSQRF